MRSIPQPTQDDDEVLTTFIQVSQAEAAPIIAPLVAGILNRYQQYRDNNGDPHVVVVDSTYEPAKEQLKNVYSREPKGMEFIAVLRAGLQGACPMCGSMGNGSLDHYLPKSPYPEFSFLSRNLIPCCLKCNNLRNDTYKGSPPAERPVHPYYDDLNVRIFRVSVAGPYSTPLFGFEIVLPTNHPLFSAAAWHLANVVLPAGFLKYCEHIWGRLISNPKTLYGPNPEVGEIRRRLEEHMLNDYVTNGSTNSWMICFYDGLRCNAEAVNYLAAHLAEQLADPSYSESSGLEALFA